MPLEADREVEVAAGVQQALRERLDAGEITAAEAEPGVGVGADHDVGGPAGHPGADAGAVGGTADLPGVPDVAQADVVGRVEPRLRAQVALGQRPECLLHLRQRRHRRRKLHGRQVGTG